jgi:hypothetical protein
MLASTASAQKPDASAAAAYRDIEATLGFVPGFFKAFPEPASPAPGVSSSRCN